MTAGHFIGGNFIEIFPPVTNITLQQPTWCGLARHGGLYPSKGS